MNTIAGKTKAFGVLVTLHPDAIRFFRVNAQSLINGGIGAPAGYSEQSGLSAGHGKGV